LNTNHPDFYKRLEVCVNNNEKLAEIAESNTPKPLQFVQKLPYYLSSAWQLLRLYLIKPIDAASTHGVAR
jgi:magnesium-protoporphyrin IX monomethyl ester (oxidative) cyclase